MRVAIIDDQPFILNLYSEMLKKTGAVKEGDEIVTFDSPTSFFLYILEHGTILNDELQKKIEEHPEGVTSTAFNVVICDHHLGAGEMDGHSLLLLLNEQEFEGESILLTGDSSDEMQAKVDETPKIKLVLKGGGREPLCSIEENYPRARGGLICHSVLF